MQWLLLSSAPNCTRDCSFAAARQEAAPEVKSYVLERTCPARLSRKLSERPGVPARSFQASRMPISSPWGDQLDDGDARLSWRNGRSEAYYERLRARPSVCEAIAEEFRAVQSRTRSTRRGVRPLLLDLSSRRTPGPHTAESFSKAVCSTLVRNNCVLWLWVPAFAGTTWRKNDQNGLSLNPGTSAGRGPGAGQWKRRSFSSIGDVVDAGLAPPHQAVLIELPFSCRRSDATSRRRHALILKAHGNVMPSKAQRSLIRAIVQFLFAICG